MAKSTKQKEAPKSKDNKNIKSKIAGLYSLALSLTELVSVYIFTTQDNKALFVLAGILGIDASIKLGKAFLK